MEPNNQPTNNSSELPNLISLEAALPTIPTQPVTTFEELEERWVAHDLEETLNAELGGQIPIATSSIIPAGEDEDMGMTSRDLVRETAPRRRQSRNFLLEQGNPDDILPSVDDFSSGDEGSRAPIVRPPVEASRRAILTNRQRLNSLRRFYNGTLGAQQLRGMIAHREEENIERQIQMSAQVAADIVNEARRSSRRGFVTDRNGVRSYANSHRPFHARSPPELPGAAVGRSIHASEQGRTVRILILTQPSARSRAPMRERDPEVDALAMGLGDVTLESFNNGQTGEGFFSGRTFAEIADERLDDLGAGMARNGEDKM